MPRDRGGERTNWKNQTRVGLVEELRLSPYTHKWELLLANDAASLTQGKQGVEGEHILPCQRFNFSTSIRLDERSNQGFRDEVTAQGPSLITTEIPGN